ncbi:MAG TPA: pyruvate dehydrogenase (acetyl-transferring) E1 component subunit alpha [Planctomycetes bacterium]|nr:pyruvate dehydrogenase (acetyl-transferring) E1 component subunit alpha [Planctomycetota bacterium]
MVQALGVRMSTAKKKTGTKTLKGAKSGHDGRQLFSILEEGGHVAKGKDPKIPKDELIRLYRAMITTRIMEERALNLQRQGRIGFYVPCKGQEASHIGTAYALKDSDWVFPAYRQPGIMILRGAPMQQIVDEWYGNEGDICKGRQMPVHYSFRQIHFVSISSPIGTQMTQAVGAGMAAKYRKEDTVFMTYCGDGGTSENDFHCSLNFGGVYKAPVVFVVENNQWAISTPLETQTASETLASKAEAYGIPGVRVDGNDILAIYQVTKEAVDRARRGGGPTLIETLTYRVGPHSSSDDPSRYRDDAEVQSWMDKDPIERLKAYLKKKRWWSQEMEDEIRETARSEINAAIRNAEEKKPPSISSMFEDVYLEKTTQLVEQEDYLKSFGDNEANQIGEFPL